MGPESMLSPWISRQPWMTQRTAVATAVTRKIAIFAPLLTPAILPVRPNGCELYRHLCAPRARCGGRQADAESDPGRG